MKSLGPMVCLVCLVAPTAWGAPPASGTVHAVNLLHARWPFFSAKVRPLGSQASVRLKAAAPVRTIQPARRQDAEMSPIGRTPANAGVAIGKTILEMSDARLRVPASLRPATFEAFDAGADPAIAVGHQYLVIISDHRIAFYGRHGKLLPSKHGEKTDMSADEFFRAFWEPVRPDGTPNTTNINAHLGFPPNSLDVNPLESPYGQNGAITEFYDTRCFYDPVNRRFFLLSAARNHLWFDDNASNPNGIYNACVRRYFAFAVSKTEDPRDGFEQWITTDSNYADWPRMAVANGLMTVAHNSPQSGKPFAYVFSEADMLAGSAQPVNWYYTATDFPGAARVLPVTQYGESGGITYLVAVGSPIRIFGFVAPATVLMVPPVAGISFPIDPPMGGQADNPKYRNGFFYFCSNAALVEGRLHVRVTRIPVSYQQGHILFSMIGYLDYSFGKNGPGDAAEDLISYEKPALSVNKNGDCAIVYGRVGYITAKHVYPEVRYSLLYHGEAIPRPSTLVHEGEFGAQAPSLVLDLANAAVDPLDDRTLWLCHAYADREQMRYRIVVARVDPGQ